MTTSDPEDAFSSLIKGLVEPLTIGGTVLFLVLGGVFFYLWHWQEQGWAIFIVILLLVALTFFRIFIWVVKKTIHRAVYRLGSEFRNQIKR